MPRYFGSSLYTQLAEFSREISTLNARKELTTNSNILKVQSFPDRRGLLWVGARLNLWNSKFAKRNPIILPGKQRYTRLLVEKKHLRLVHAGSMLVPASLTRKFHITASRRIICALTLGCVICKRVAGQPRLQLLGQLSRDRLNLGMVFDKVGVDCAGPIVVKSGPVCMPVITKAYMCVFMSLIVKAVHLEAASELITTAFIACLHRFIVWQRKPMMIWSDHGTNLRELLESWKTTTLS